MWTCPLCKTNNSDTAPACKLCHHNKDGSKADADPDIWPTAPPAKAANRPSPKKGTSGIVKALEAIALIYMLLATIGAVVMVVNSIPKYGAANQVGISIAVAIFITGIVVTVILKAFAAAVDALRKIEKNTRPKG